MVLIEISLHLWFAKYFVQAISHGFRFYYSFFVLFSGKLKPCTVSMHGRTLCTFQENGASFQSSIRVPTVEGTSVYVHMLAHWCMLSSIVSPETCGYESISVVASLPANAHCWNHHDWTAAVLCCVYMCVRVGCAHTFLLCTGTQLLHKLRSRALSVRLHLPHLSSLSLSHTRGTQKSTGSNKLGRQARRKDSEEDLQSEALTEWIYRDILSVPAKSVKAWLEL